MHVNTKDIRVLKKIVRCPTATWYDIQCTTCGGYALIFEGDINIYCQIDDLLKPYFITVDK